ncbi:hypothetical protein ACFY3N_06300 [Streptomyces sp. NPDC000348]
MPLGVRGSGIGPLSGPAGALAARALPAVLAGRRGGGKTGSLLLSW